MEEGMEIRLSTNICTTVGCKRPKVGAVCRVKYPDTAEKLTFMYQIFFNWLTMTKYDDRIYTFVAPV